MLRQILTEAQEALLAEERRLLGDLDRVLEGLRADEDRRALADASSRLETLFAVTVVGVPGASVELLADALLGRRVLTASEPAGGARHVRRSGLVAGPTDSGSTLDVLEISSADAPVLERLTLTTLEGEEVISLVDRFGSSGGAEAQRPDLALVLTTASQPLAGLERELLRASADRASRVIVVVDDMEMLRLSEDVDRMQEAVAVSARRLLGRSVPAYGVSTTRLRGLEETPPPAASLVPALARQVEATLRAAEIVAPKLRMPAQAGEDLAERWGTVVERRLEELAPDRDHLEAVDGALAEVAETAEAALLEAEEEADRVIADYGAAAKALARSWTRPFRIAGRGRLLRRFEEGPGGAARERLEALAETLEQTIREAGERGRTRALERLAAGPTPRLEEHPVDPSADGDPAEPDRDGAQPADELLRELGAEPTGRTLIEPLRRASLQALVLLVAGVVFAAVPALWGFDLGSGLGASSAGGAGFPLLPVVLGGGLGGAAILESVVLLELRRRTIMEALEERVEGRRATAGAALAALAEARAEAAARRIRAPLADYAETIAEEIDRLESARSECDRLRGALGSLLRRIG